MAIFFITGIDFHQLNFNQYYEFSSKDESSSNDIFIKIMNFHQDGEFSSQGKYSS